MAISGYFNSNPLPHSDAITPNPTPSSIVIPIAIPTRTNIVIKKSVPANMIDCIGPDGKQFKTSMDECKKLNESWSKPIDYMVNCNIAQDCGGGTKYIKKSECDKPCIRMANGSNNQNTNSPNYPPCTIYYSALGFSQTYYSFSPEECLKHKNEVINTKTNLITCVVSYPCNGTSDTYQVDQNICNFMQSGAASTCSTYDAIKTMQDIGSKTYDYPQAKPIDGTIHMDPTPTCRLTPYGCY